MTSVLDLSDPATEFGRMLFGRPLLRDEAAEIVPLLRYRTCTAEEVILAEGSMNELLYFLVKGAVAVVRAGETIATIRSPGTLLGEMSISPERSVPRRTWRLNPRRSSCWNFGRSGG